MILSSVSGLKRSDLRAILLRNLPLVVQRDNAVSITIIAGLGKEGHHSHTQDHFLVMHMLLTEMTKVGKVPKTFQLAAEPGDFS